MALDLGWFIAALGQGDSGPDAKVVVRLNTLVGPYGALTAITFGLNVAYNAISGNRANKSVRAGHVKRRVESGHADMSWKERVEIPRGDSSKLLSCAAEDDKLEGSSAYADS